MPPPPLHNIARPSRFVVLLRHDHAFAGCNSSYVPDPHDAEITIFACVFFFRVLLQFFNSEEAARFENMADALLDVCLVFSLYGYM